jgi:hypothetical protein
LNNGMLRLLHIDIFYFSHFELATEFCFLISVIPSNIRWYRFTSSWLYDYQIKITPWSWKSFTALYNGFLSALSKDNSVQRLKYQTFPPASRLTIRGRGGSLTGRVVYQVARVRLLCNIFLSFLRSGFLCGTNATLFYQRLPQERTKRGAHYK